jgi:hypothetical protein
LHTKPQLNPSQVGTALGGAEHGAQEPPQLCVLELLVQTDPQR